MSDERKDELNVLEPHEFSDFVNKVAIEANRLINQEIMKQHEKVRWLLKSRMINVLFFIHYGPTITATNPHIEEKRA